MQISYETYDSWLEAFEKINSPIVWPTEEQLKQFEANPSKWIPYAVYITEKGKPAKTEDKRRKSAVLDYLYRNLELI